jgi:phage terminase large subunit GpA-like protein
LKRGYKVWPIAGNLAKSELYGWLALQPPDRRATRRRRGRAAGVLPLPEHGEEYFKQLTAEQLVPHKTPRGSPRRGS